MRGYNYYLINKTQIELQKYLKNVQKGHIYDIYGRFEIFFWIQKSGFLPKKPYIDPNYFSWLLLPSS